jgi:hypothetical protein
MLPTSSAYIFPIPSTPRNPIREEMSLLASGNGVVNSLVVLTGDLGLKG